MQEIERKFLVKNDDWLDQLSEKHPSMGITQAYIVNEPNLCMRLQYRIRRTPTGIEQRAAVNMKSPREGLSRTEIELDMDPLETTRMIEVLRLTHPVIDKIRHFVDVPDTNLYWEIDVFNKGLTGLRIAEIEIPSTDYELDIPAWIGDEVTDIPEYYNANLALRPENG